MQVLPFLSVSANSSAIRPSISFYNFIPAFFIREETAQGFQHTFKYIVRSFLDGNHAALEVYIYYLFIVSKFIG